MPLRRNSWLSNASIEISWFYSNLFAFYRSNYITSRLQGVHDHFMFGSVERVCEGFPSNLSFIGLQNIFWSFRCRKCKLNLDPDLVKSVCYGFQLIEEQIEFRGSAKLLSLKRSPCLHTLILSCCLALNFLNSFTSEILEDEDDLISLLEHFLVFDNIGMI
jgi:hypothetical protein